MSRLKPFSLLSYTLVLLGLTIQFAIAQDSLDYGRNQSPIQLVNLDYLHQQGYTGEGVTIALLDVGYDGLDSQKFFQRLFDNGQIKATKDFWTDSAYVYHKSTHGTFVSSNIAVKADGQFVGGAPDVNFLLAITDDIDTETHEDERKWKAAMKWADSLGADIISSSLGYFTFDDGVADYSFRDMDGETTIVAKAAREAARRGMLVVTSAGNFNWRTTTPCNVDSVLCVGGVSGNKRYMPGAATGPTADGRTKPDVAAQISNMWGVGPEGVTDIGFGGTSASAPMISSIAACLMEAHPDKTYMQIMRAIEKSGHQADEPDTLMGYGVPNARVADSLLSNSTGKIERSSKVSFKAFPNPAKDYLSIEISRNKSSKAIQAIELWSGLGQRLRRIEAPQSSLRWNIQNLSSGVYVLRLETAKHGTVTQKVIKR